MNNDYFYQNNVTNDNILNLKGLLAKNLLSIPETNLSKDYSQASLFAYFFPVQMNSRIQKQMKLLLKNKIRGENNTDCLKVVDSSDWLVPEKVLALFAFLLFILSFWGVECFFCWEPFALPAVSNSTFPKLGERAFPSRAPHQAHPDDPLNIPYTTPRPRPSQFWGVYTAAAGCPPDLEGKKIGKIKNPTTKQTPSSFVLRQKTAVTPHLEPPNPIGSHDLRFFITKQATTTIPGQKKK